MKPFFANHFWFYLISIKSIFTQWRIFPFPPPQKFFSKEKISDFYKTISRTRYVGGYIYPNLEIYGLRSTHECLNFSSSPLIPALLILYDVYPVFLWRVCFMTMRISKFMADNSWIGNIGVLFLWSHSYFMYARSLCIYNIIHSDFYV